MSQDGSVPNTGVNRRRLPRVRFEGAAKVFIGKHVLECEGMDLSATGMRIRGSWSAYRGQSVKVALDLDGATVHAFGEVVWSSGEVNQGWGIRFTALHPSAARKMARFVESRPPIDMPVPGVMPVPAPMPIQPVPYPQPYTESDSDPEIEPDPDPVPDPQPAIEADPDPVAAKPAEPEPQEPEPAAAPPPIRPIPCTPEILSRLSKLLDGSLASASILRGAKGAIAARDQLYVQFESGPIVVLPGNDPVAGRLRWLAASVATWTGAEQEQPAHGPEAPLVIRA